MQSSPSFEKLALVLATGALAVSACFNVEARSTGNTAPASANASPASVNDLFTVPPTVCDWYAGDNTPPETGTPANPVRYGWIDIEAGYWGFTLDPTLPVGTKFRINGHFPHARNFSIQLYAGNVTNLQTITDYQIQPDPGSHSPYNGINTYDSSVQVGPNDTYTLHIVYGVAPSNLAPNTFYVDDSRFTRKTQQALFLMRVYNALPPFGVKDHGGVELPAVVEETAQGDVSISQLATPTRCNAFLNFRNNERLAVAKFVDTANANPARPDPIPANKYLKQPQFQIYETTPSSWLVNGDNEYIYAKLSQTKADMVLMRAKAPTYATQPGVTDPQLRHWAVCENAAISFETYTCIEDYQATIDQDGYFNIVLSWPQKKPANANAAHGFDWLNWNTTYTGVPIYRQMLPSPNFTKSAFEVPTGADPAPIMGEYWIQATYCAKSVFDTHTQNGESTSQVFEACKSGQ
jgi:hypothetical protein